MDVLTITWGWYGGNTVSTPVTGFGRIEYTIPRGIIEYTLSEERLEFTLDNNRLEYTGQEP